MGFGVLIRGLTLGAFVSGLVACGSGGGGGGGDTLPPPPGNSSTFSIGGAVTGLAGSVSITLNAAETLTLSANGAFTFTSRLAANTGYQVAVTSQPTNQICSVANGGGVVTADVTGISITCSSVQSQSFKVDVTFAGLLGDATIALNDDERLTIRQDGNYQFNAAFGGGDSYNVEIEKQPQGQECASTNATGHIDDINPTVAFTCSYSAKPAISHIWPSTFVGGQEARISGSNLEFADVTFNGADILPTLRSAHQLSFVVPSTSAGSYSLELRNSEGVSTRDVELTETMRSPVGMDSGNSHTCAVLINGTVYCWGDSYYGQVPDVTGAIQVSAGANYSCAISGSGTTWCWGDNRQGQLGNTNTTFPVPPSEVANLGTASYISAGGSHTCAVVDGGAVKCWGDNNFGQLGNGNTSDSSSPVAVSGITNAVSVSAGYTHSCALLNTGALRCWGSNDDGQLGNGTATSSTTPVAVNSITNAVSLSAGEDFSCAVLANGTVACWGTGNSGELGNGGTSLSRSPILASGISTALAVSVGNSFDTSDTESNQKHACALLSDGTIQCWGGNDKGQLGNGSKTYGIVLNGGASPASVIGVSGSAISVGGAHSCALTTEGEVKCWGRKEEGQLGNGDGYEYSTMPVTIDTQDTFSSISTGGTQSCALTQGGEVSCWGYHGYANAGQGYKVALNNVVEVSSGVDHNCALINDGSVRCWGANSSGQLGDGNQGFVRVSETPVTALNINDATAINAGSGGFTCALRAGGSVACWGANYNGQLGVGDTSDHLTATPVIGVANAVAISDSCALLSNGSVKCWGPNSEGQLGNGNNSSSTVAVQVSGISNATAISGGFWHTCALLNNSTVKCWGANSSGQLGNGSTTNSSVPVLVAGINNAVAISVGGGGFSCALLADGSVKCWGYNHTGQLGNGLIGDGTLWSAPTALPEYVRGLRNAVGISAGSQHACALMSNGQLQCWGNNMAGQLNLPYRYYSETLPSLPVFLQ